MNARTPALAVALAVALAAAPWTALDPASALTAPDAPAARPPTPDATDRGGTPPAAASPDTGAVFRVEELADGVWAAVVLPEPAAYAFANSLVVEGEDGVLVVDTQQSPTAARALLERIRGRTDAPVRWVVNTHWHGDHVNGNQVYRDAFPGVRIVAHEATRREMLTAGRAWREEEIAGLPASLEERRGWLETGVGPGGAELTDGQLASVRRSLELRTAYLAELRTLRETPPDVTFDHALTLHLGDRVVELVHPGAGHTPGDIVVRVPSAGVLAVGDLLEEGPLWLDGADVPDWAAALATLMEIEADVLLPSHGGVHRDRALLEHQAAFLGAAVEVAREARAEGLDAETAAAGAPAALARFRPGFARLGVEGDAFDEHARDAVREAWLDLNRPRSRG